MARSELKKRQEFLAKREASYDNVLKSAKKREPVDLETPAMMGADIFRRFGEFAIRQPHTFSHSLKTKDKGKIRLAYANHYFMKYRVPYHLQQVWYEELPKHVHPNQIKSVYSQETRIQWFIAVATGKSLYKEHTKSFLTKKETHAFLNCPLKVTFKEAIWYAIASSHTSDIGIITRVFKSKLTERDPTSEFWRDIARFFVVNPVPIQRMNDLLDFIMNQKNLDASWNLKGRTLTSLQGQMEQWHRDLARVRRMGNMTWTGVDIPNFTIEKLKDRRNGTEASWTFTQLTTSKALADEGNKMHHCVYSYQHHCVSGRTSIWSVKAKYPKNLEFERALTIEVNNSTREIVQVRGYANRLARDNEREALKIFAAENGLGLSRWA